MATQETESVDEIVADVENGMQQPTQFDAELRVAEDGLEWVRDAMNEGKPAAAVHEEMRCVFRKLRELAGANTRHATEDPARLDELRTRVVQYTNVGAHFMLLASRLREAAAAADPAAADPDHVAELERMHKDMAVYVDTQQSILSNIAELSDTRQVGPNPAAAALDPDAVEKYRKKMKRLKIIIASVVVLVLLAVVVAIVMSQVV